MGEISLKVWEKEGKTRVYIGTRYLWHSDECKAADGAYFYAGEDGLTRVMFQSSMSGIYGLAAYAVRDYLKVDGLPFSDLLARIEAAKTKGGNFSAVRYFKQMEMI